MKEYDNYGYLIFEGEYLNGNRNGKGKEYKNGDIVFDGEYENGRRKESNYFCFIYWVYYRVYIIKIYFSSLENIIFRIYIYYIWN